MLRDPSISALLPGNNGTCTDKVPMICDKQVIPASTLLSNFSMAAKSISESSRDFPPPETCPCHTILDRACTDIVSGHVMSTNFDFINNEELRRQFYYGSVFKEKQSSGSIIEAITLGLNDYVARATTKLGTQITADNSADLNKWKTTIVQRCTENLNHHRSAINKNYKRSSDATNYLKKTETTFCNISS